MAILGSLSGFRIGIIVATFHMTGIAFDFSDRLKISVEALRATGPKHKKYHRNLLLFLIDLTVDFCGHNLTIKFRLVI